MHEMICHVNRLKTSVARTQTRKDRRQAQNETIRGIAGTTFSKVGRVRHILPIDPTKKPGQARVFWS